MALIEIFLIFCVPGIAAAVAIRRKFAWYAATAALAFFCDIIVTAVFMMPDQQGSGNKDLASLFGLLAVDVSMIAFAAASGKKCPSCQSRIHPKAVRCPRCQANVGATV